MAKKRRMSHARCVRREVAYRPASASGASLRCHDRASSRASFSWQSPDSCTEAGAEAVGAAALNGYAV